MRYYDKLHDTTHVLAHSHHVVPGLSWPWQLSGYFLQSVSQAFFSLLCVKKRPHYKGVWKHLQHYRVLSRGWGLDSSAWFPGRCQHCLSDPVGVFAAVLQADSLWHSLPKCTSNPWPAA